MKFLLDANLSFRIASLLRQTGHEATHVRDVGLRDAPDEEVLDQAEALDAVLVSQDSDFTNLLFRRKAEKPSLVLLRGVQQVTAADIAGLIVANLDQVADALAAGAVVSLYEDRIRVRRLPIQ